LIKQNRLDHAGDPPMVIAFRGRFHRVASIACSPLTLGAGLANFKVAPTAR
jgi:hypothetical protein